MDANPLSRTLAVSGAAHAGVRPAKRGARTTPASRLAPTRRALAAFGLGLGLPLYLALQGGGYEEALRNEVGIALWWVVLAGILSGALPLGRPSRAQLSSLSALLLFGAWTGLTALWSLSPGRTVAELSRISSYAAILALAIVTVRADTRKHLLGGVLTAILAVSALSLLSRLHPSAFPANETAAFLAGARSRLNWPLNYWNALAAFAAIGMPLALHLAASARRLVLRSAAAATIPLLVAVIYLTFSRGGWIELGAGLLVLLALSPHRLALLASVLTSGVGAALLIAAIRQRPAIISGLTGARAESQGSALIAATLLVCLGVGLLQAALSLLHRHRAGSWAALRGPSPLRSVPSFAWVGGLVALALLAFLLASGPSELAHAWSRFENPAISVKAGQPVSARLFAFSGNGRWQYWLACLEAFASHPIGIGAGAFQLWWFAHGSLYSYVINAHSLYFETLAETGLPGILLLLAFFAAGLGGALRRMRAAKPSPRASSSRRPRDEDGLLLVDAGVEDRSVLAAIVASCLVFCVAAIYDWVWQIPALPALLLLLLAAGAAGASGRSRSAASRVAASAGSRVAASAASHAAVPRTSAARSSLSPMRGARRVAFVVVGLLGIAVIAWPLSSEISLRQSKSAASAGALHGALSDARSAQQAQPFSAEPPLQRALVLERQRRLHAAAAAARRAIEGASSDWRSWLVLSRIEAERGRQGAALAAWRKARSLDPHDPLFKTG